METVLPSRCQRRKVLDHLIAPGLLQERPLLAFGLGPLPLGHPFPGSLDLVGTLVGLFQHVGERFWADGLEADHWGKGASGSFQIGLQAVFLLQKSFGRFSRFIGSTALLCGLAGLFDGWGIGALHGGGQTLSDHLGGLDVVGEDPLSQDPGFHVLSGERQIGHRLLQSRVVVPDGLVASPAALDAARQPQIGHSGRVGRLIVAHLLPAAHELSGAQPAVARERHDERRQVRARFVAMNRGRDDTIGPVLVGQPLPGSPEKLVLLLSAGLLPPLGGCGHQVLDGQHCIPAPFLRQQCAHPAHSLVGAGGGRVLVGWRALGVCVGGLALAVAVLQGTGDAAHSGQLFAAHDGELGHVGSSSWSWPPGPSCIARCRTLLHVVARNRTPSHRLAVIARIPAVFFRNRAFLQKSGRFLSKPRLRRAT